MSLRSSCTWYQSRRHNGMYENRKPPFYARSFIVVTFSTSDRTYVLKETVPRVTRVFLNPFHCFFPVYGEAVVWGYRKSTVRPLVLASLSYTGSLEKLTLCRGACQMAAEKKLGLTNNKISPLASSFLYQDIK